MKKETVEATGHKYEELWTIDKPATISEDGSKSKHCTLCDAKDSITAIATISEMKLSLTKYVYTGEMKEPVVTVTDSLGNVLVCDKDYKVTYADGRINPGRYKVLIQFIGEYAGEKELYFSIVPKAPKSSSANLRTVSGGYDDIRFTWEKSEGATGYFVYFKKVSAKKWSSPVTVTGKTYYIKKNLDDGVEYIFKVIPYYKESGKTTKYYNTSQYKTARVYTLKKISALTLSKSGTKVKVKWKNINGETGYQISQAAKKNGTKIVKTYKTTKATYTTVKATKGKTYYYKVRAYKVVDGKKVFGPWSTVKAYKRK